jgi:hypothetical protein
MALAEAAEARKARITALRKRKAGEGADDGKDKSVYQTHAVFCSA